MGKLKAHTASGTVRFFLRALSISRICKLSPGIIQTSTQTLEHWSTESIQPDYIEAIKKNEEGL
jgi:hypothetical protein